MYGQGAGYLVQKTRFHKIIETFNPSALKKAGKEIDAPDPDIAETSASESTQKRPAIVLNDSPINRKILKPPEKAVRRQEVRFKPGKAASWLQERNQVS